MNLQWEAQGKLQLLVKLRILGIHLVFLVVQVVDLQQQLREILGSKVEIKLKSDHSGQILIPFDSNETFERITGVLRKTA